MVFIDEVGLFIFASSVCVCVWFNDQYNYFSLWIFPGFI